MEEYFGWVWVGEHFLLVIRVGWMQAEVYSGWVGLHGHFYG